MLIERTSNNPEPNNMNEEITNSLISDLLFARTHFHSSPPLTP